MGKSRHFFPGGNTCYGFYSFYQYLVKPTVKRKYILKGGPGVGKSNFMKKSASTLKIKDTTLNTTGVPQILIPWMAS